MNGKQAKRIRAYTENFAKTDRTYVKGREELEPEAKSHVPRTLDPTSHRCLSKKVRILMKQFPGSARAGVFDRLLYDSRKFLVTDNAEVSA